jgi:hypothetical protein
MRRGSKRPCCRSYGDVSGLPKRQIEQGSINAALRLQLCMSFISKQGRKPLLELVLMKYSAGPAINVE